MAAILPDEMPSRWLDQIRALIEASKGETRSLIEASKDETRSLIEASASETRRHFDLVAEGLRSDIRAIAEGHAMLNDKLDGFQPEVRRGVSPRRSPPPAARSAALSAVPAA